MPFSQNPENIFQLNWGKEKNQIGLRIDKNLRYGPQSIATFQKKIYILDRENDRIQGYDLKGKLFVSHPIPSGYVGLAVGEEGIVVYCPFSKSALGITGKFKDKKFQAPSHFAAISEMWFSQGELWGRYGWSHACFSQPQQRQSTSFSYSICQDSTIYIAFESGREKAQYSIPNSQDLQNCYSSGQIKGNKIALSILSHSKSEKLRKQSIILCDIQGKFSKPINLSTPWSRCFQRYTLDEKGNIYEMILRKRGILIRYFQDIPLVEELKQAERFHVPSIEASTTRRSILVWFRDSNTVKNIDLEEYLKGVVSQEIYGSWLLEAHKSMAIAARTYAVARYRHRSPKANVCTTTCCQAWTAHPTAKAIQAVQETKGQYIKKAGKAVTEPLYFSHCSGHTKNSEDHNGWNYISYLRSRPCGCGWNKYYGHGVGMCQYGMQAYAKKGWDYVQIIEHYYTGCTVGQ